MKTLIALLLMVSIAAAASVEVTWDANPVEDAVTNYKIYFGNYSGNSRTFVSVGTVSVGTATSGQVMNLSPLQKWYFRVTASNAQMESLYSNMVAVQFIRTPSNNKFQKIEIR
jgi:fibronectin type 3 domain-containing protein